MTMREKLAAAIEDAMREGVRQARVDPEGDAPDADDYRKAADAVLEAMRSPTEAMAMSGVSAIFGQKLDSSDGVGMSDASAVYTAMIDAARTKESV